MKKRDFGNFFEEFAWQNFRDKPTIENRAVWREAKELNKIIEKDGERTL